MRRAWRKRLVLGVGAVLIPAVVVLGLDTVVLPAGSLTTTDGSAWGGVSELTYPTRFDFSAGPTTITVEDLDLTDIWFEGEWPWPPLTESQGAQARFGVTANGFWSMHSIHSAIGNGGGSWDAQSADWDHDDGFRKYLIQNQWSGTTPGVTVGDHQYNVEAFIPRVGAGASVNNPGSVTDRSYNTFDMRIVYTPTATPGEYEVQGQVRLHKAASTDEMAVRPGSPEWGSPHTWVWSIAVNNQVDPEDAWVPYFEGSWVITGDYTSARPYFQIINWGVPQTRSHTFSWSSMVVEGELLDPDEVWVDDDWSGYAPGDLVDGHIYGYDAFAGIQDGIDAVEAGGTVHVAAGTYNENVAVNKRMVIDGAGSGAADTVITPPSGVGVVVSATGSSPSERLALKDLRVTGASTNGIDITAGNASHLTFDNVACVSNGLHGINTNPPTGAATFADLRLTDCSLSSNASTGLRVASYVGINGLVIAGGHLDGNVYGMQVYTSSGASLVTNVSVSGTTFDNNTSKGMYIENLDHATFSDITVGNSGTAGAWAAGVDINLKYHAFESITFTGATVTGCGSGDPINGVGLTVKARDDGSYSSNPATLNNVQVTCSTITGCQEGIRFGEPGKNNAGPANVAVHDCTVTGNALKGLRNESQALTDATNNWWGTIDGAAIAGMVSGDGTYDPWLAGPPPCGDNILWLNVNDTSLYVKPSESVVIDMDALNLLQPVTGVQAVLSFSSTYFSTGSGDVSVVPGGGPWTELIYNVWTVDGDLDVAVGVDLGTPGGTDADATTAVITLTPTGTEGVTQMVFRPDVNEIDATFFSDTSHQAVWPTKIESQLIVIDGTDPVVANLAATQGGTDVLDCAATTVQGTVDISVDASDALAGLEAEPAVTVTKGTDSLAVAYVDESPSGTFNYTVTIAASTPNGTWDIDVTATDKAGNSAGVSGTLCVNKKQVGGTVSMDTFSAGSYGFSRDVVFKATDGSDTVLKTWTQTVSFVNKPGTQVASGSYTLTDVPSATVNLSAKTAWSLRQRQAVTMDGSGQATNDFTLAGGDLNGTNAVNILDYSILKENWNTTNAVADINGDGSVQTLDYSLLKDNWFTGGDPE